MRSERWWFRARRRMARAGYEAGAAAGSWLVDGNTSAAAAARLLVGLADGDPAVLDLLPAAPFSGEWAGDPTPADVLAEVVGWGPSDPAAGADEADELIREFELAFSAGAHDEVTWSAAAVLGLQPAVSRRRSDQARRGGGARAYAIAAVPSPVASTPGRCS